MELRFEWDEKKNAANIRKHGLSFEEAIMVFSDPKRCELYDHAHSFIENRWKMIGIVRWCVLIVSFTERRKDKTIRIISARKADKNEIKEYLYGN